jgi:hypothetical protein
MACEGEENARENAAEPPVVDLHAELLMHLHGFSHGIAELGSGWDMLARRLCRCVPCVGHRARGDRFDASPAGADAPHRLPLAAVPLVGLGPQVAVAA